MPEENEAILSLGLAVVEFTCYKRDYSWKTANNGLMKLGETVVFTRFNTDDGGGIPADAKLSNINISNFRGPSQSFWYHLQLCSGKPGSASRFNKLHDQSIVSDWFCSW